MTGYAVAFALTMGLFVTLTDGAKGPAATTVAGIGMVLELVAFGIISPLGCLVGSIFGFRLATRRMRP